MLKWFNIEKSKHTTKNYTVWKDTNNPVNAEYEMYSYETLVIKGTLDSLEITGLYSMTTRRHIRWFADEHATYDDKKIPFSFIKKAVENENYRLDILNYCVWNVQTGEVVMSIHDKN